jgi:hypothetical protein
MNGDIVAKQKDKSDATSYLIDEVWYGRLSYNYPTSLMTAHFICHNRMRKNQIKICDIKTGNGIVMHMAENLSSLCLPMPPYDTLWLPIAPYGSLRLLMAPIDYWLSTDPFDSLWLPMALYGSLWLPRAPQGSIRLPMVLYSSLWLPVASLGSRWFPMASNASIYESFL